MKLLLAGAVLIAAVLPDGLAAAAPAPAAASEQEIMIIIVTSGPGNTGGVAMTRLSFPSPEACAAAAKILQEDIRGGFVTARCLRTH